MDSQKMYRCTDEQPGPSVYFYEIVIDGIIKYLIGSIFLRMPVGVAHYR
ncbi:MAG: hypothetical protein IPH42_03330 [Bacteroidetes bacterium]|nr:hypothetical protein [Bacteroidota bacterium]